MFVKKIDIPHLTQIMIKAYHSLSLFYLNRNYGPPGYDLELFHQDWMRIGKYYKILYEDVIIGGFIIDYRNNILFLNYFFIDIPYQHKGIGSHVLKFLDTLSDYCIEANTPDWAIRNQEFYIKNGFKQVDTYYDKTLGFTLYFYKKFNRNHRI